MAISTHFDTEFTKVPPGYHLTFATVPAAGHSQFQFSYAWNGNGYTISGGSEIACEQGAADLLEELGFRYYTPDSNWWKYPSSIASDKVASLKEFTTPIAKPTPLPDSTWALTYSADRAPLQALSSKYRVLNGVNFTISTGHLWQSIGAASILESYWQSNKTMLRDVKQPLALGGYFSFTPDGAPPTGNAPIVAATAFSSPGAWRLLFGFSTDGDDGSFIWCCTTTSTQPSKSQIEAGQNHTGAAAVDHGSVSITASGTYAGNDVVCTRASLRHYVWGFHRNAALQESDIISFGASIAVTTQNSLSFALETIDSGQRAALINICAQWLLRSNAWLTEGGNFHQFDATDGDISSSDLVFPFASDVAMACRTTVPAIGPYAEINSGTAVKPRANAQLGLYSYAGHKRAPSVSCPGIVVAVASAYNSTGLTLPQLMEEFAPKVDLVGVRDYFDVFDWSDGKPLSNYKWYSVGLDQYIDYYDAGLKFVNGQSTANWIYNAIMNRRLVKTWRTGVLYSYDAAVTEIVNDVFNGDQAVYNLYTYWGNRQNKHHKWSLKKAFDYVNAMQEGWYKLKFQKLLVIVYEQLVLPKPKDPLTNPSDPFPAAFSLWMSHVLAVRNEHIVDSWEYINDLGGAGGIQQTYYPSLKRPGVAGELPGPLWYQNPVMPTVDDFNDYYAILQAGTQRDEDLDSMDLVLVRNVTPEVAGGAAADGFNANANGMTFAVLGPATIDITYADTTELDDDGNPVPVQGITVPTPYPEGLTITQEQREISIDRNGALVFMDYGQWTTRQTGNGDLNYLYIPRSLDGQFVAESSGRLRLTDASGNLDVVPETDDDYVSPANVGPGQIRIQVTSTSGAAAVYNGNRWISPVNNIVLTPRKFADQDFPKRTAIRRGA